MTLGERIKEQRKTIGYSQEKIAELVGTSRQAVTKWEADQSIPCMENMIRLTEIFGISLNELLIATNEATINESNIKERISKPLKPLLNNLSLLGYVLFAAAISGYYEGVFFDRGVPLFVWLILAGFGGLCVLVRNVKYHEQYGKLPSLILDIAYVFAILLIPRIPLPHGYALRIMQVMAVIYIQLYIFRLCPWRKVKEAK